MAPVVMGVALGAAALQVPLPHAVWRPRAASPLVAARTATPQLFSKWLNSDYEKARRNPGGPAVPPGGAVPPPPPAPAPAAARWIAKVVLPAPPFWLMMVMTFM